MTRAMGSRTTKRRHVKTSQDSFPEDCKENAPPRQMKAIGLSKETKNKSPVNKRSSVLRSKENTRVVDNFQSSNVFCNNNCSLRKSNRNRTSTLINKDYVYNLTKTKVKTDTLDKRNVLIDKTNSPVTLGINSNKHNESLQTTQNTSKSLTRIKNTSHLEESCSNEVSGKPHIPVYKIFDPPENLVTASKCPPEKIEAVYEFDEVDENEEPVNKKKKKKRTTRKPRIGPKALTINNIKYSSTESLVSLPDKSVKRKNTKSKVVSTCIKSYSSENNLYNSEDTCYSVKSFMSHPPSSLLCNNKELQKKRDLSVLHETQSENCQSPVQERNNSLLNVENVSEKHTESFSVSTVLPNNKSISQNQSSIQQQRCYPPKRIHSPLNTDLTSKCDTTNDIVPNRVSYCSGNYSTGSSHDFLSSTPCKRASLVVRQNSVFCDSFDQDIPTGLRPSTGYLKDVSENMHNGDDKYFGFDEPEELEEPLVSPIKNINLQERRIFPRCHELLLLQNEIEDPKPDVKEVIKKLKATLPKIRTKEISEFFDADSSPTKQNAPSPVSVEVETKLTHVKPPRRSYERQRRVRKYSEYEEEEEEEEKKEEDCEENYERLTKDDDYRKEPENVSKPAKKCYQKKNISKLFKAPHVPKAKQKIIKEEEELERLAAQVNAQFQAIENCNLLVE